MLQIYCLNNRTTKEFKEGTTLLEMLPEFDFDRPYPIVSAKVNNVSQGLKFRVYNSRDVEFLDLTHHTARDLFPGSKLNMEHPISKGCFCRIKKSDGMILDANDVAALRVRMRAIVADDIPFHRHEARIEEAIKMFGDMGQEDKVKLMETSGKAYTDYYTLEDTADYYYGRLVITIPTLLFLLNIIKINFLTLGIIFYFNVFNQ